MVNKILFAKLILVTIIALSFISPVHAITKITKLPQNTIDTPFPIHAWGGYTGWFSCDTQDGGLKKAELYCKCKGYQGLAAGKPCYHSKSSSGYKLQITTGSDNDCDFMKSATDVASGSATTKIACADACQVPDAGKHYFVAELKKPIKKLRFWEKTEFVYNITNNASKIYTYRFELLTTGLKKMGANSLGGATYSYELMSNGTTKQNILHNYVNPKVNQSITFNLIYTDLSKPKTINGKLFVYNEKLDCWANVTEVNLK